MFLQLQFAVDVKTTAEMCWSGFFIMRHLPHGSCVTFFSIKHFAVTCDPIVTDGCQDNMESICELEFTILHKHPFSKQVHVLVSLQVYSIDIHVVAISMAPAEWLASCYSYRSQKILLNFSVINNIVDSCSTKLLYLHPKRNFSESLFFEPDYM